MPETLELRGIVKEFCGVRAVDGVDLTLRSGEIAALLGENGAGKTSLVNILYGLYRPDAGRILIDGREAAVSSPQDAVRLGIGMVHQHFMLVPKHTVAENISLGLAGMPFVAPEREVARRLEEFSRRYGLKVEAGAKVWQLSAGQRQKVEIVKALVRGVQVLILDEPTSVLTGDEADELFAVLRRMSGEGKIVLFITHKLDEVMDLCSTVTILRQGRVAGRVRAADTRKELLAALMAGTAGGADLSVRDAPRPVDLLRVDGLTVQGDMGTTAVDDLGFAVRSGEIFGIAGVSGNGQRELAEALTGLRPARAGRVTIRGVPAEGLDCRRLRDLGVRHIPEERLCVGIAPGLSVAENYALTRHRDVAFGRGWRFDAAALRLCAETVIRDYGIKTPSPDAPAQTLSGGNIQKLILARETDGPIVLLVAAHPTYGLDLGATRFVRRRLWEKRREGSAVLLVSEDLDEVLELSDRVAVMFEGRFMAVLENRGLERRELMLMMAGVAPYA